MGSIYLRGALAWTLVHLAMMGPIFLLIGIVAAKGQARYTLRFAAAIGFGAAASGLIFGGPLAALVVGGCGLRGASGYLLCVAGGIGLALVEEVLFLIPSRAWSKLGVLTRVFAPTGALSGLGVAWAAM